MQSEIEAKFLGIDHDVIRARLEELGAVCEQPMRLMRRVTIDTDAMKQKSAFLRVRDEGNKVTMTYKQFTDISVDGAKEIEVIVNDFKTTIGLLAAVGLSHRSFQESKRETWRLGATEIMLDEWPWLVPYIEIEGESEAVLQDVAKRLNLDWNNAVFGDVMTAYRAQYPSLSEADMISELPEVRFNMPLPDFFKRGL